MSAKKKTSLSSQEICVGSFIQEVRGQKVILDSDLACLYGVPTKVLNQAVKRNIDRFPQDFMFRLTHEELEDLMRSQNATALEGASRSQFVTLNEISDESDLLRSQNVTSKDFRGGRRYLPYAFTEHGAIMAASVLNSPRAVQTSLFVVRAFVRMRQIILTHKELAKKLSEVEKRLTGRLDIHEEAITDILKRIMLLLEPLPLPPARPKGEIGFHVR